MYIPEGFCQAIRVRVLSSVSNNYLAIGIRPDWSVNATGQAQALSPSRISESFPPRWTSQRLYSPYVTYCPSDYASFRSPGTWFVAVEADSNFNATVIAEAISLRTSACTQRARLLTGLS